MLLLTAQAFEVKLEKNKSDRERREKIIVCYSQYQKLPLQQTYLGFRPGSFSFWCTSIYWLKYIFYISGKYVIPSGTQLVRRDVVRTKSFLCLVIQSVRRSPFSDKESCPLDDCIHLIDTSLSQRNRGVFIVLYSDKFFPRFFISWIIYRRYTPLVDFSLFLVCRSFQQREVKGDYFCLRTVVSAIDWIKRKEKNSTKELDLVEEETKFSFNKTVFFPRCWTSADDTFKLLLIFIFYMFELLLILLYHTFELLLIFIFYMVGVTFTSLHVRATSNITLLHARAASNITLLQVRAAFNITLPPTL